MVGFVITVSRGPGSATAGDGARSAGAGRAGGGCWGPGGCGACRPSSCLWAGLRPALAGQGRAVHLPHRRRPGHQGRGIGQACWRGGGGGPAAGAAVLLHTASTNTPPGPSTPAPGTSWSAPSAPPGPARPGSPFTWPCASPWGRAGAPHRGPHPLGPRLSRGPGAGGHLSGALGHQVGVRVGAPQGRPPRMVCRATRRSWPVQVSPEGVLEGEPPAGVPSLRYCPLQVEHGAVPRGARLERPQQGLPGLDRKGLVDQPGRG